MKKIGIIVPCFNEEDTIESFYIAVKKELNSINYEWEILFVNDGSTDKSLDIMKNISDRDQRVLYLSFSRNFGKEAAIFAGMKNINADYIGLMDVDMQDPPALLPQMIKIMETEQYDCVATRRKNREGEPILRSWFARKFYKIMNAISDVQVVDGARDFRIMKKEMVESILKLDEYNRFSKGIFGWVGYRTYWISYNNIERVAGSTKWNFWKLFKYAIDGIINFSSAPLDMASWFGFLMTVISFISLLFIIIRKIVFGDPVAGWASTICIIIFIGGLQLFFLGIIGQYIAKIYLESKKRPHFIISESNIEGIKTTG